VLAWARQARYDARMPMEIFGPASSRTRRPLWTAEECGAEYVHTPIALMKGEHFAPEFRAINPSARVPVLRDGDLVLFESAAICRYIARKHPAAGLLPEPGTRDDALVDQWCFWVCTELEQPLWSMGKHRFAIPEEYRIDAMQRTALWEWERATPVLAGALAGREFLVGDRLSVADILAGHTLAWARANKIPLGSEVLDAYLDRLKARPAFQRTLALP
jgi:glutathione S-transferase